MIKINKTSLEKFIKNHKKHAKDCSEVSLPIALIALTVGTANSAKIGYQLAQGIPVGPINTLITHSVCSGVSSLYGSDFCDYKKELVLLPTVYAAIQGVAIAAGYGVGSALR
jgi:hypothetical protein|tara:strand:+ start:778 stop:1113 length:336 start_codon:yes stop_codon:yes gene_type:complete